jgi:hypothetical protein
MRATPHPTEMPAISAVSRREEEAGIGKGELVGEAPLSSHPGTPPSLVRTVQR